jgi:hypothetical protein
VTFIGIDDTDMPDSPGTNQLARAIVRGLAADYSCLRIVRHQLLQDPRVPCTSKNGSASIVVEVRRGASGDDGLIDRCREVMREWFVPGSDPGLCVAAGDIPSAVRDFGVTCQSRLVAQEEARTVAAAAGVHLEGLGGTEGGVIGALAAVGLAAEANDGRIVQWGQWPDDLSGLQAVETIRARSIEIVEVETDRPVETGSVDVGKHLRPNLRGGRAVLFIRRTNALDCFEAVRLL